MSLPSQPVSLFRRGTNRSNRSASKSTIFWRRSGRLLRSGPRRPWKPRWPSEHPHSTANLPGGSSMLSSPPFGSNMKKKLWTLNITPLFVLALWNMFQRMCVTTVTSQLWLLLLLLFLAQSTWIFRSTACQREVTTSGVPAHSSDFNFYTQLRQ